jgi:hypothetical protein
MPNCTKTQNHRYAVVPDSSGSANLRQFLCLATNHPGLMLLFDMLLHRRQDFDQWDNPN